jgi:hypothetical protein
MKMFDMSIRIAKRKVQRNAKRLRKHLSVLCALRWSGFYEEVGKTLCEMYEKLYPILDIGKLIGDEFNIAFEKHQKEEKGE